MPGRRKTSLSRSTSQSRRKQDERAVETEEKREARLATDRARHAAARAQESAKQREARLASARTRQAASRAGESEEERAARLADDREYHAASRADETEEDRTARLSRVREYYAASRADETEEDRAARLSRDREYHAASRADETEEDRAARLSRDREYHAASRADETEEDRAARLSRDREYHVASRAGETEEDRAARLSRDREYQAASRADETEEDRAARLSRDRAHHSAARLAESQAERDTRRRSDRIRQAQRRSTLTEEEHSRILEARREDHARRQEQAQRQREERGQAARNRRMVGNDEDEAQERRPGEYLPWRNKEGSAYRYDPLINYRAETDVGPMNVRCTHCDALKWKDERAPTICCNGGKVSLPPLPGLPNLLKSLIVDCNHDQSRHFLEKTRAYNSAFMMTSFGAKEIVSGDDRRRRGFQTTFKVRGQVFHLIGSLLPPEGAEEQFIQLYFVADERTQATMRMSHVPNLQEDLVRQLQRMLHAVNPLVRELKTCLDTHMREERHNIVIRADRVPRGEHPGRHNAPTVDEVAVIIVGQECERRDIVLRKRDGELKRISETHRSYDALQYPLMFPTGEDGYHIALRHVNPETGEITNRKMTPKEYYSYRLMVRGNDDNRLLRYRQLTNQYIVDMYAKVETERLSYLRTHQNELRVEEYAHLQDALRQDVQARDVGRPVILPSSFVGGPRYMHEKTQDAFMYVRKYGRPDLFITFTTNPKWAEIKTNLFQGQQAKDRHDLVSRVFKLKVKKLLELVVGEKVFGPVRCYMYSVEWQKRGLPHIHLLLWLEEKIRPNQIDDVISAELPDPRVDPELYEIVRSNMVHGPCGPLNPSCVCMENGRCKKRYPRRFLLETVTGEDGYPAYKRRRPAEGGFTTRLTVNGTEIEVDNRWVVPYSPVLCRALQAHINVEYCSSVKSIKYICKYVNKGSDRVSFEVRNQNDEIEIFQTGRYLSTSEAMWRLLGFDIHERSPPVMHLHVHLENFQRVMFRGGANLAEVLDNPKKTTLVAFFELCLADEFARTLLYEEVPAYFTFDKTSGKFNRRKRGKAVQDYPGVFKEHVLGRMYTVHIRNAECFCLRMLLHTVRGPTSFEALRTVNGVVLESYEGACAELGLLHEDEHLDNTLDEAVLSRCPYKLRELFTVILLFSSPPHDKALQLWEKYKDHLSEDFLRQIVPVGGEATPEIRRHAEDLCLKALSDNTELLGGQPINSYGLPAPRQVQRPNMALIRETSYDRAALEADVTLQEPQLTTEQRSVYDEVLLSVERRSPKVYFLDAPGGTGKTFLIKLLLSKVRLAGGIALAVASSGIAATLLPGGKTAHSLFKIPIDLDWTESPVCSLSKQSNDAEVLKQALLLIWDECTMANKKAVEAVDRSLRDIRNLDLPFGGMTVLFSGDFRQTLPVVSRGTRADEVDACLKRSNLWRNVTRLRLTRNMRVAVGGGDGSAMARFSEKLLAVGEGREPDDGSGNITLTEDLCTLHDLEGLISAVYPDICDIQSKPRSWLCERAILTPKNEEASALNTMIQERFQGEEVVYRASNRTVNAEDSVNYPTEFLASVTAPGLPPQELTLKVGSPVMLLRNLKPPTLCNGTRLQVTALHPNVVEATILTGVGAGEDVFIPRIPIIPSNYPFQFKRIQFPLSLCFAMTINKSQGQTLRVAGLDLRSGCFSHGQLYVACSRVSSTHSLYATANGPSTPNVVYKEVIND